MKSRRVMPVAAVLAVLFSVSVFVAGLQESSAAPNQPDLTARGAILVAADTGEILFARNAEGALPPASMTKVMTEYLILKAIREGRLTWDTVTTVSRRAEYIGKFDGNSDVGLLAGQKRTVEELFAATALRSGNDATVALAELAAGSEKAFVESMNAEAARMGLEATCFLNCTGLPNAHMGPHIVSGKIHEQNVSSARDIALLTCYLLDDFPEVTRFTSAVRMNIGSFSAPLVSHILLLPGHPLGRISYAGLEGVKTGYTDAALYCFTGSATRNGVRLISVVMGCRSSESRDEETRKLLDYGFAHYHCFRAAGNLDPVQGLEVLPVGGGEKSEVRVVAGRSLSITVRKGDEKRCRFSFEPRGGRWHEEKVPAPIIRGEVLGAARLVFGGGTPNSILRDEYGISPFVPLIALENVSESHPW